MLGQPGGCSGRLTPHAEPPTGSIPVQTGGSVSNSIDDLLPDVTIFSDVSAAECLARFEQIADSQDGYETYRENAPEISGGWELLGLRVEAPETHRGLAGQLIATPLDNPRLLVKVLATRWKPKLSYDVYVSAIHEVFDPLLREYNRVYESRRRLTFPRKESLEPRLPPKSNKAFQRFASLV